MTAASDRLELSRLVHRLGLGPKPGEYARLLAAGIPQARATILAHRFDPGLNALVTPPFPNMGQAPSDPTASAAYWQEVYDQSISVAMWWMDRMVLADYPFIERMTWFWHGHWATSISKVSYALPMKIQNDTLRKYALGNFADMSRAMVRDGALIFWLDGEENVAYSPNENLGREFMELFTLGVGNYSQTDVHQAALGFTGYNVDQTSGAVTFEPKMHDNKPVSVLGKRKVFDAESLERLDRVATGERQVHRAPTLVPLHLVLGRTARVAREGLRDARHLASHQHHRAQPRHATTAVLAGQVAGRVVRLGLSRPSRHAVEAPVVRCRLVVPRFDGAVPLQPAERRWLAVRRGLADRRGDAVPHQPLRPTWSRTVTSNR